MLTKKFVLDTNVILHDASSIFKFQEHAVFIPITVIEEVDNKKKEMNEVGRNARQFSRYVDELRATGSLADGVTVNSAGGTLQVLLFDDVIARYLPPTENLQKNDNQILATALYVKDKFREQETILITKDTNLRIKADIFKLQAEDYSNDKVDVSELYTGHVTLYTTGDIIDKIYKEKTINIDEIEHPDVMYANQFFTITNINNNKHSALVQYNNPMKEFKLLYEDNEMMGITPKNAEQQFATELLRNPNISLVTITGLAGSGKTLLSVCAGLEGVMELGLYKKIILAKPIVPMDNSHELGFLPGTMEEKLIPWLSSFVDNIDVIMPSYGKDETTKKQSASQKKTIEEKKAGKTSPTMELFDMGVLEMGSLEHIRGRSRPDVYFIIDECFPGNQHVETESGKATIISLYNRYTKQLDMPKLKTYNEETKEFEFKHIKNVINKGERELLTIKCANREIKCTPEHPFLTKTGWKRANELLVGDYLMTSTPDDFQMLYDLNEDQYQVVLGSFMGDGHLQKTGLNRYRLKVIHGISQEKYCNKKSSVFNTNIKYIQKNGYSQTPACTFATKVFGIPIQFPCSKTTVPQEVLDTINEKGLAIWFMDDGWAFPNKNGSRLYTSSFDEDSQQRIVNMFKIRFGIECYYTKYSDGYFCIVFSKDSYLKLTNMISPYFSEDVFYKLPQDNIPNILYEWNSTNVKNGLVVVDSIEFTNEIKEVFDIEMEDNHNFMVCSKSRGKHKTNSGIIAHNCQNLTPHAIKTIITRAGKNTKVILLGDITQIDCPYLDASNNALSTVIEKFKGQEIYGHITLRKSERSPLAELAAILL